MCKCFAVRTMRYMRNSATDEAASTPPSGCTLRYRMAGGRFFRHLLLLGKGKDWIIGMGILLATGITAGVATADIRWSIVCMMLIFIVAPMMAAILYFNYGMRRECYLNIARHELRCQTDGILVILFRNKDDTKDNPDEEMEEEESYRFLLPYSMLGCYMVATDSVTVPAGKGFLWIPRSAFPSEEDMKVFMDRLNRGISSATERSESQ